MSTENQFIANAIIGIDTLWGGDVMCPSGTGRFIADSWFSDDPLPLAYTAPSAAKVRESGGVGAKQIDHVAIIAYLKEVDLPAAIEGLKAEVLKINALKDGALRGKYLAGLAVSMQVMWELALEMLGQGPAVPYERCVMASTGRPPEASSPTAKRERAASSQASAAS